jgi:hypothetical protein
MRLRHGAVNPFIGASFLMPPLLRVDGQAENLAAAPGKHASV